MTAAANQVPREKRMSLGEHLVELRKRIVIIAIAIAVGAVAGWFVSEWVWAALEGPVRAIAELQDRPAQIVFPTITGAFDLRLQIAIYTGIIISSPVWLYQVFAYFVPALTRTERKYVFGFFFSAVPLFFAGCWVGWMLLPHMVQLLTSFVPTGSASFLDAGYYFQFVIKLMIAVGIAFVVPVFLVMLNFIGLISAKAIITNWRIALVVILLFTAIATPAADVISMFLLAIPMIALYFAAYFIAVLHDRRAAKRQAEFDAEVGVA